MSWRRDQRNAVLEGPTDTTSVAPLGHLSHRRLHIRPFCFESSWPSRTFSKPSRVFFRFTLTTIHTIRTFHVLIIFGPPPADYIERALSTVVILSFCFNRWKYARECHHQCIRLTRKRQFVVFQSVTRMDVRMYLDGRVDGAKSHGCYEARMKLRENLDWPFCTVRRELWKPFCYSFNSNCEH